MSDKKKAAAVFNEPRTQKAKTARAEPTKVEELPEATLPLELIRPNPNQPRRTYDEEALGVLADSLKERGMLQPMRVLPRGDHYIIINGERRYRAATQIGMREVPVTVEKRKDYTNLHMAMDALAENVHREDLTPVERYFAVYGNLKALIALEFGDEEADSFGFEEFGAALNRFKNRTDHDEGIDPVIEEGARQMGINPATYAREMSNIWKWSEELREAVLGRAIPFDVAQEIHRHDPKDQSALLARAIEHKVSAATFKAEREAKKQAANRPVRSRVVTLKPRLLSVLERLERVKGARLEKSAGKRVDELEKLLQRLEGILKDV